MSGTRVMLGWAAAAFCSACCTAQPVASSTWTMRRWLWPPSRVRCQRVAPSATLNGTPSSASRSIAAGALLDHELDGGAVVEPGAGDHRVLDMALERVAGLQHRGDPALRPAGRASEPALGQHRHLEALGEVQRRGQPRRAGADDQDVEGACSAIRSGRAGQVEEHVLQIRPRGSRRRRCRAPRAAPPRAPRRH